MASLPKYRFVPPPRTTVLILIFLALVLSTARAQLTNKPKPLAVCSNTDSLSCTIIELPDKTFGYMIYVNGKLFIRQLTIPGVSGTSGFKSYDFALKVAQLTQKKIKQKELPPAISKQELIELNVIKN